MNDDRLRLKSLFAVTSAFDREAPPMPEPREVPEPVAQEPDLKLIGELADEALDALEEERPQDLRDSIEQIRDIARGT